MYVVTESTDWLSQLSGEHGSESAGPPTAMLVQHALKRSSGVPVELLFTTATSASAVTELRAACDAAGEHGHVRVQDYDEAVGAARGAEGAYEATAAVLRATIPSTFEALAHVAAPHQALLASLQT